MTRAPGSADLARAACEAVRALNHSTLPGRSAIADHHELCSVLADLAAMLHTMPQALRQVEEWLTRQHDDGRLWVVDGDYAGDPSTALTAIRDALSDAASSCADAARGVEAAHQVGADLVVRAVADPLDRAANHPIAART
jgi:prephenate dehydratase